MYGPQPKRDQRASGLSKPIYERTAAYGHFGRSQIQTEGAMGKARLGGTIETNNLDRAYRRINL